MSLLLPTIGFGIVTASILALAAVGFTLQFGVTGVVNFAFGDLMTLAAYIAWLLNTGLRWNLWAGAAGGMIFLAVASVLMNRLLLQPFIRKRANLFSLLIVTFDEDGDDTPSNLITTIFAGPMIKAGNYTELDLNVSSPDVRAPSGLITPTGTAMNHWNVLATIEDSWTIPARRRRMPPAEQV